MHDDIIRLDLIAPGMVATVGGKAASLAELTHVDGVAVPAGFCVSTAVCGRMIASEPVLNRLIDQLSGEDPDAPDVVGLCAEIRSVIEQIALPEGLRAAIAERIDAYGEVAGWAVRSSATSEDAPTTSFAGQHDSYLNVRGSAIADHVPQCWASLYTDRAVAYRNRHGIDHRTAQMAVLVQQMLAPDVAGVMFTADPVTSNRTIVAIEATIGLSEALVSGLVPTDSFNVRNGILIQTRIATKTHAVQPAPGGGTYDVAISSTVQDQPALTDGQVIKLAALGRRIEAHLGTPQDIEWCLIDDEIHVVQSRPITTLFPVPDVDDDDNHVYVSVGHGQMMTDPMTPLGLSMWQLTSPAPTRHAGGRLFVDVTSRLASPARAGLLELFGRADPLLRDALETVLERDGFVARVPANAPATPAGLPMPGATDQEPVAADSAIVDQLVADNEASVAELRRTIKTKFGPELFEFILDDLNTLKGLLFHPQSHRAIMAAMETTSWVNDHLHEWLGETNAADTLAQAAPNNIAADMGLALLDVADSIRPHPGLVEYLRTVRGDGGFLDCLSGLPGGDEARRAIDAYLDIHGMRCVGEIDITRPRWAEAPATLVPLILLNIDSFEPGERTRRTRAGRDAAERCEHQILQRLRALPDGEAKAAETKQRIDILRTFIGYREYPKYGMIRRYFAYKQALLAEAARLVTAGVLDNVDDIHFLSFDELHQVVATLRADAELLAGRRQAFGTYAALNPPRVLTSDGEALNGSYHRHDLPDNALVGLAVSSGTVEGRARIITDFATADLEPGDILVTTHTDPSWAPLFLAASGLVTEVGGLMTHGAVVAREYGLPAVVGVPDATRMIQDRQRIRIDGTHGTVEILI